MVSTLLGTYLIFLLLLNFQPIKNIWIKQLEKELSEIVDSKIIIGDIDVGLFNRVTISNAIFYDQNDEILLKSQKFSAKILLRDFIKRKITLRSVLLMDTQISLYQQTPNDQFNYQFLIDLLTNTDEPSNNKFKFSIGSLIITRANLSFHKRWLDNTQDRLNPDNFAINNLNANLSINSIERNNIDIRVRNLSCTESSGFEIKKLSFSVEKTADSILVNNFLVELPNTLLYSDSEITCNLTNNFPLVNGNLQVRQFSTQDLSSLFPVFKKLNVIVKGSIISDTKNGDTNIGLGLKEINNRAKINLTAQLKDSNQTHFTLHELQIDSTIVSQISDLIPTYSQQIQSVKNLSLNGHGSLNLQNKEGETFLSVNSSSIGNISTTATLQNEVLNIEFSTLKTNLSELLNSESLPTNLTLSAELSALLKDSLFNPKSLAFHVISAVNERYYDFSDIKTNLNFKDNSVNLDIFSKNPNHNFAINASGKYVNNNISNLNINADVMAFNFDNFAFSDSILNGVWSGKFLLNAPLINPQTVKAKLQIDSVKAKRSISPFELNQCIASIDYLQNKPSTFTLLSDVISANIDGVINHKSVIDLWKSTITKHISQLSQSKEFSTLNNNNSMSFHINIHDGKFLNKMLLLPLEVSDATTLHGKLHKGEILSEISIHTSKLAYQNTDLENVSLHFKSRESGAGLLLQGRKDFSNDKIQFVIGAQLHDNLLETNIEWDGIEHHKFAGNFNAITSFINDNHILTSIQPTTIHVEDSIWNVSQGEILLTENNHSISNLTFKTAHQKLTINGGLSSVKQDSLQIALENINVGDILDAIDFTSVLFDGEATGNAFLSLSPNSPFLQTNLKVKSFHFNNTLLGDAHILGDWQSPKDSIQVNGKFIEKGVSSTIATGTISPSKNAIDLDITANETNLEFLRYWVKNIVTDISGRTSGTCRLYGTFSNLDLSGAMLLNASLMVPANGVSYNLTDSEILITPGLFKLEKANISAANGGTGKVKANLNHNNLKNFTYNLDLDAERLLLYDKERSSDMPFYATAYANGHVKLTGNPSLLNLEVEATPTDNSIIVYTESEIVGSQDSNDGYITYRNASKQQPDLETIPFSAIHVPSMDMHFQFNINMNPSATLKILMDEVTGDYLNLRGNGILSANYYNKGSFQLYGNYDITGGNYQMSIQDLLKKNFEIQSGSSIIFGGNPDEAQLGLKAVYTVPTASLADLNIGENFSDRNIRANCILNIEGTANSPRVNFDLELPNINDDEKQMVRKLIATEEDLNMQVIHLLALGRFYTYDYAMTEAYKRQSQSTVVANSFLSSTLSNQLNEVISNAIGTNDWTFGTNLSTGTSGWSDMEVDGIISGRLFNNRLIVNGNIGYHENQYNAMRGSNFVGDFDAKYILTPNGGISLKAYSQTNDRYFTKSALTTQGFGIQFQKEFINIKDLFRKKKSTD